jgi:hypothetical protein
MAALVVGRLSQSSSLVPGLLLYVFVAGWDCFVVTSRRARSYQVRCERPSDRSHEGRRERPSDPRRGRDRMRCAVNVLLILAGGEMYEGPRERPFDPRRGRDCIRGAVSVLLIHYAGEIISGAPRASF